MEPRTTLRGRNLFGSKAWSREGVQRQISHELKPSARHTGPLLGPPTPGSFTCRRMASVVAW